MITNALNHTDKSKLSLVMPVLDEGVRIIPAITTLAYTVHVPFEIIIVYDSDESITVNVAKDLQNFFPKLKLVKNSGKGVIKAINTGFDNCESDILGIWVSYHVDPFGVINQMYDLAAGGFEFVSGNRFNKIKRVSRGNPIKKLFSRTGNYLLNRLIGIPLGDITTNIKIYHKKVLEEIPLETKTTGAWAMVTELTVKCAIKGYKLADVEFLPQNVNLIHGISNFRVFKHLDQYVKWLMFGFKNRKIIKKNYPKSS